MSDTITYPYTLKAFEGAVTVELQCRASYEPRCEGSAGGWFFEEATVYAVYVCGCLFASEYDSVLTRDAVEQKFGGLLLDLLDSEALQSAEAKREEYQEA